MSRLALALALAACLAVTGCPRRKQPERGAELVFKKVGDVRPAVEKRLAQLGVVARITEDDSTLTVRVPESKEAVNLGAIVKLLTVPAKLEFCAEVPPVDGALCDVDAGVTVMQEEEPRRDCYLQGAAAGPLLAAVDAGATARLLVGPTWEGAQRTFLSEVECFTPRLLEAEPKPDQNTGSLLVALTFDGPSATKFGDLTRTLVRKRLLVVLDGKVTSAPIVMEAITGGRAMLTFGRGTTEDEVRRLAQALAGGALGGSLTLEREGAYGPPSLVP